jgi:dienelactone hydrolase
MRSCGILEILIFLSAGAVLQAQDQKSESRLHFEAVTLAKREPPATVHLMYRESKIKLRPVILMLGALQEGKPPAWSTGLLEEGYMLVAFRVAHPPDPDPEKRPQWLVFDQRFAHSYVLGGARAPEDAGRVIDYLTTRADVDPKKIGWMGSSSTGIPGLAVATREPRLAAIVAFVSAGAYEQWLATWHTHKLWRGKTKELWPETRELLKFDPIRHVENLFPTAVLMVSGSDDKIVDPDTARAFVSAARPYYKNDPERLRLVVYEGFAHNLPIGVVKLYTEHWFRTYLHPTNPPPKSAAKTKSLDESVKRTQINDAKHKVVVE